MTYSNPWARLPEHRGVVENYSASFEAKAKVREAFCSPSELFVKHSGIYFGMKQKYAKQNRIILEAKH